MVLKEANTVDSKGLIKITPEWMAEKYDEMNKRLFDGRLSACNFKVFTTGKGSQGKDLGHFCMKARFLFYNKENRRLYKKVYGGNEYINRENFYRLTEPLVELNGNYKWTEKAALSTLVHEMCHYYTCMNGWLPAQSHGVEFRSIAAYVSAKSNDFFTVQRLAAAEELEEMELDPKLKAKKEARELKKKEKFFNSILAFSFNKNGTVFFYPCADNMVLNKLKCLKQATKSAYKIIVSVDDRLKEKLFSNGYSMIVTDAESFYDVTREPWVNELDNYDTSVYYDEALYSRAGVIPHFKINIGPNGEGFELSDVTEDELKDKLRQRFPKWSDEAVNNIAKSEKYRR